ncbi:DinB family protein [Fictibacillus sp. FJAT-27399]|uniref:DinB family protein n=1 Tax=Fictibacillus sp. FJAT-27399 TaxID=1729689 RepID=UPI0006A7B39E|nr:DinB family protein [Fictibacillus sp. FJAT-27399]
MKTLFRYNWQVREDWYKWCEGVPEAELLKVRTGGVGGILHTLFHIIDVEWSWIRGLQEKPDFQETFDGYQSLEKVRKLDAEFKPEVENFVLAWNDSMEERILHDTRPDGRKVTFTHGEIMRHVIAHEIHHIGQLSVWAREIGTKPVTANLIDRGLNITIQ